MKDGKGLGIIYLARARLGGFSERELARLQVYADQAVIAIDNARLFRETQDALAHQTASAEVLSIISRSVTDLAPVYDIILERCEKLCEDGTGSTIQLLGDDGLLHRVRFRMPDIAGMYKHFSATAPDLYASEDDLRRLVQALDQPDAVPMAGSMLERALQQGGVLNCPDVLHDPDTPASIKAFARRMTGGHSSYSVAVVALLEGERPIGVMSVGRLRLNGVGAAEGLCRPDGHRHPERPPVPRGSGSPRGGRDRQRRQERLPGHDEPRDPHADERGDRHERAAAGHRAHRGTA
jgi:hypothetical protein